MRLTVSLEPAPHIHTEPLTSTRPLGQCLVAGRTLQSLQEEACRNAGLEWVETDGDIRLYENAWVSSEALAALVSPAPPRLVSGDALLAFPRNGNGNTASDDPVDAGQNGLLIRYPWQFLTLQERLLAECTESRIDAQAQVHPHATVDGVILVGSGTTILPGVYIEGVAVIGKDCKIGPNAYLRGMTMIGDGCHVGQAVEIKNSIIYSKTAMGHLSYCGDSVVGQGVNFGAGTIVSNFRHDGKNHRSMIEDQLVDTGRRKFGAIIGDGVHTGIHTSIYPGRKMWPHTTTRPGDVVQRDLKL